MNLSHKSQFNIGNYCAFHYTIFLWSMMKFLPVSVFSALLLNFNTTEIEERQKTTSDHWYRNYFDFFWRSIKAQHRIQVELFFWQWVMFEISDPEFIAYFLQKNTLSISNKICLWHNFHWHFPRCPGIELHSSQIAPDIGYEMIIHLSLWDHSHSWYHIHVN